MFGIPEWAIGIAAILLAVSVLKVVTARLIPPDYRRRRWIGTDPPTTPPPDDVPARLAELDDLKQRVVELEERVDFAERLLAKQREAERLRPG